MRCSEQIRSYINGLSRNLFARRELVLLVHNEDAVDDELARLVEERLVVRVACGVYSYLAKQRRSPTTLEIAEVRARAFGKAIMVRAGEQAVETNARSYFSDGARTSFNSIHGRILLKHIVDRHAKRIRPAEQSSFE